MFRRVFTAPLVLPSTSGYTARVLPCRESDVPAMMQLYSEAIAYQHSQNINNWVSFKESEVLKEVKEGRQFKILLSKANNDGDAPGSGGGDDDAARDGSLDNIGAVFLLNYSLQSEQLWLNYFHKDAAKHREDLAKEHNAVYVHRISTNQRFRGKVSMVPLVMQFVRAKIQQYNSTIAKEKLSVPVVEFIRMDTTANNEKLNRYYCEKIGCKLLGEVNIKDAAVTNKKKDEGAEDSEEAPHYKLHSLFVLFQSKV